MDGRRRDNAVQHIRDVNAKHLQHGIDDLGGHRRFQKNVIRIAERRLQSA